jgi:hypothetical protein
MTENHPQARFKYSGEISSFLNNSWQKTSIALVVLFLFACLLFLVGLERRHLWNADEPREAGITAEMARSGDFIVPRLNGLTFLEKPPLYYWVSSIAFRLLGESTYTARFISALAAIGGVLIVFILARAMKMSITGAFMSGFVLATSALYWSYGRYCLTDMTLSFFITASMACFYQTIYSEVRRKLWFLGFVLSMAGALLTKGLVGLAVPISAIGFFLIVKKDFSLKHWLALVIGVALSCIPYSIWIWMLYNDLGKEAVYVTFWVNNFGRFTGGYPQHVGPFYYYLEKFPGEFLPWTIFLPLAFFFLVREVRKRNTNNPSIFILSWFVIPFVLLSISAGKRSIYMIPLYPAAALAVGYCFDFIMSGREKITGWFAIPSSILAFIALITPLVFLGIRLYYHQSVEIMVIFTIIGFGLGLYSFLLFRKQKLNFFFKMLLPSFLLIFLTFDMAITPIFNQKKSFEPLFKYALKLQSEGNELSLFLPSERLNGAAVFYLGRNIQDFYDFETLYKFIHDNDKIRVIAYKTVVENISDIKIIKEFKISKKTVVIFTDNNLSGMVNEKSMDPDNYHRDRKSPVVVDSE